MQRRRFIRDFLLSLATVPIIVSITRCGTTTVSVGGVSATISGNHGHVATLTGTQVSDAVALALDITGTSGHSHTVTLTAADMVAIKAGTQVSKTSSIGDSHDHAVTFN